MPSKKTEAAKQSSIENATLNVNSNTPREKDNNTTGSSDDDGTGTISATDKGKNRMEEINSIDDSTLPKSIIMRLAKGVLPPNTSIQKDALTALTRSATVFANYLASHAHEITVSNNKKTIAAKDVLDAIDIIELGGFKGRLEGELEKFNEIQAEKRARAKASRNSVAATTAATAELVVSDKHHASDADISSNNLDRSMTDAGSGDRPTKRPRKSLVQSTIISGKGVSKTTEDEEDVDDEGEDEEDAADEEEVEGDDVEGDSASESGEGSGVEGDEMLQDVVEDVEGNEGKEDDEDEALDDGTESD